MPPLITVPTYKNPENANNAPLNNSAYLPKFLKLISMPVFNNNAYLRGTNRHDKQKLRQTVRGELSAAK